MQVYSPLMALTNAPVEFAQSLVSFERVFEVLDIPVEIVEAADAQPLTQVHGRIEFQQVSFSYQKEGPGGLSEVVRFGRGSGNNHELHLKRGKARENGESGEVVAAAEPTAVRLALDDVSFTIEAGQLVALVG